RQLVLNRVFDSDNLPLERVHFLQTGIEGRGFTGTRWACDQNHTVGTLEKRTQPVRSLFFEAQLPEVEQFQGLDNADYDRFPVTGRKHRNSEIKLLVPATDLDTAVLRQT